MKVHSAFYVIHLNVELSCKGGMGVKVVGKNNPIKMNVCDKNQPLAAFLRFSAEFCTRHSFIFQRERGRGVYIVYFSTEQNQSELCLFPAVSLGFFIFHSKMRGGMLFYVVYTVRWRQILTVLKSVVKGKVKYMLSTCFVFPC